MVRLKDYGYANLEPYVLPSIAFLFEVLAIYESLR